MLVALTVAPAFADATAAKRAQATAVQAQIDSLNTRAEVATERYDQASQHYADLTVKVRSTEQRIGELKSRQTKLQSHLATRAGTMYRTGGALGGLEVLLGARTFQDFIATLRVLESMNRQDASTVKGLKQAKAEATTARATLVAAQSQAKVQKNQMAASEQAVKSELAAKQTVLSGLNADILAMLAAQQRAEAAAAHARELAFLERQRVAQVAQAAADASAARNRRASAGRSNRSSSAGSGNGGSSRASSGGGSSYSNPPSGGSTGSRAVSWAMQALGRPYVWAASGPGSFDCSGLTMWAYGHAGVSLSHSSGAQIGEGARVSRSGLQPGDLVFFGSPIHHVGMYVGGGDFIEAPHSGADVRIATLSGRGDYAGACRPR